MARHWHAGPRWRRKPDNCRLVSSAAPAWHPLWGHIPAYLGMYKRVPSPAEMLFRHCRPKVVVLEQPVALRPAGSAAARRRRSTPPRILAPLRCCAVDRRFSRPGPAGVLHDYAQHHRVSAENYECCSDSQDDTWALMRATMPSLMSHIWDAVVLYSTSFGEHSCRV